MCDTMAVVTEDGVLLAKNSDRDPNEAQVLRRYDATSPAPGTSVRCTWSAIPQAGHTHAVLLSQPWWMWGAEMGANEHGVVIGNEAVFTRRTGAPESQDPLLGMDLLRLALERAEDRHRAVEVIVTLLQAHGQGGAASHEHPRFQYDNSFLVADPEGVLVLETAGRHWATEEVAGARSISNGLTIPGFAERFADPVRGRVAQCRTRQARTTAAATAALTPADLIAALRDHGGAQPAYSPVNGALSAPCAHAGGLLTSTQSTASWVADLRTGAPAGGRHWVTGTSAPCTGLFKPLTFTEAFPDGSAAGSAAGAAAPTNHYDADHLWWRHEVLHRRVVRDPGRAGAAYVAERDALEQRWLADPPTPAAAFAEADRRALEWLARVAEPTDTRPVWVRALWRRWDRAAGLGGERR